MQDFEFTIFRTHLQLNGQWPSRSQHTHMWVVNYLCLDFPISKLCTEATVHVSEQNKTQLVMEEHAVERLRDNNDRKCRFFSDLFTDSRIADESIVTPCLLYLVCIKIWRVEPDFQILDDREKDIRQKQLNTTSIKIILTLQNELIATWSLDLIPILLWCSYKTTRTAHSWSPTHWLHTIYKLSTGLNAFKNSSSNLSGCWPFYGHAITCRQNTIELRIELMAHKHMTTKVTY